ncbi:hypothetical protein OCK02_02260 [Rhizobium sp. TRM96647]|uniref:hypothetical protein n=1 Tax=unclassified Rhizobium TaxID=2613769 RepID=UPI0021E72DBC|nr:MULTISPECIES: hypothetical protein [unclassified Rhizobium]MCV3735013.1 hypothetical protein [Rhizobium sp. TRM96647]MCV3757383.1 hypothetical protein [Rhizobium sp. TRM96650]
MLAAHPPAILAAEDASVLHTILDDPLVPDRTRSLVRRKLTEAHVIATEVPGDVVTINSRISFRLGDGAPISAFLVDLVHPLRSFHGMIPLRSDVGLSLLGLREGSRVTLDLRNVPTSLMLKRVLHQPQRQSRAIFGSTASRSSGSNSKACPSVA